MHCGKYMWSDKEGYAFCDECGYFNPNMHYKFSLKQKIKNYWNDLVRFSVPKIGTERSS